MHSLMRRDPVCRRVADRFHSTNLYVLKHEVVIAGGSATAVPGAGSVHP